MPDPGDCLDFEATIAELDARGYLDRPGTEQGVDFFYQYLADSGVDANNPDAYRAILVAVTCMANLADEESVEYVDSVEWITRLVSRALRDLMANGG